METEMWEDRDAAYRWETREKNICMMMPYVYVCGAIN